MIANFKRDREVFAGDIIRWNANYIIPEDGELLANYFLVKSDMPTNNGNFKAVNHRGHELYFNTIMDDYTIVKRA